MGRPTRPDIEGAWYHVINRGAGRGTIFFDERDRVEFERLFGIAHERFGVTVHAYCWMTNHYHVLLECPSGDLSRAMHLVGSRYVRHINDRLGRDGPLFRDRFFTKRVTSDAYLLRLIRYIHRNPVAIVGEERLIEYPWSSLRTLAGYRRCPSWMQVDTVLAACGGRAGLAQLVLADSRPDMKPLEPEALLDAIDLMVDEHAPDWRVSRTDRTVASLVLDRLDGDQRALFARALAFPTPGAERAARSRARRQLGARPDLATIVEATLNWAA